MTNYIFKYSDQIQNGTVIVGTWIKKIYKILTNGILSGRYLFDWEKAEKAIRFIENFCHHCETRNDLITLELWQKAIVSAIFGVVDKQGLRVFREVFIVVARKNGKTLFASAIIAYMAYIDGEYGAKIFCLAPKLEQSYLVYDNFLQMILQDGDLSEISKKRRSDIYIKESNTSIKPLAFSSKKSDGFNPHLTVNDEIASWVGDAGLKQYEVMKSALGARSEPLILSISTAGYENDGIFDELMNRSTSLLNGDSKEERLLPFIYMIDDIAKWDNITELKKSNPNMNVSVKEDFYRDEIIIARNSHSKRAEFLTKYCNIKQNSSQAWLEYTNVDNAMCELTLEDFKGCYALGGVDLSQTTDLTAASVVVEKDGTLYCFTQFFMPSKRFETAQSDDGVPYDIFLKQGHLRLCGEGYIDNDDVFDWFEELREKYELYILQIGYDRYNAKTLVDKLKDANYHVDDVYQGENLTPILKIFEGLLLEGKIKIGNRNNLLKAHFLNVAIKHNAETRKIKPVKIRANMRIDGFVSVIDALTVRDKWWIDYGELLKNEN